MTLCDTGPLVALLNRNDPNHRVCTAALVHLSAPLVTTQACFTEAMYLLGRDTGFTGQSALWQMIETKRLVVSEIGNTEMQRAQSFMTQYKDVPCDYADASLLAYTETQDISRLFTIDRHFYVYRLADGRTIHVIPESM